MTLLDSMKWWLCWPWFKSGPPKKFPVGISVAEAILLDGTLITITCKGRVFEASDNYCESTFELSQAMACRWVHADNNTYYNRNHITSYEVNTKPYLVYKDNTPVETGEL
jgi:hypothetical protein